MIHNLFEIKIYKVRYPDNLDILRTALASEIDIDNVKKNNQGSMRGDGICSYVDKRDLHMSEQFQPLKKFIEDHAKVYWHEIGYNNYYTPKVIEMWANVYKKDSFIDIHNHAPRAMTSSFYLNKKPGIGNLVFENPLSTLLKHQPYYIDKQNYHTLFEQQIDAESGDLIIFPGWLNHKTLPNATEDRIMIGTNICAELPNQN